MGDPKSITIRLDEPELIAWARAQSSPMSSTKTAIKMCMYQYGRDVDVMDAIIREKFHNENSPTQITHESDIHQTPVSSKPLETKKPKSEKTQSEQVVLQNPGMDIPQQQPMQMQQPVQMQTQQPVQMQPQQSVQPVQQMQPQMIYPMQQTMNQQMMKPSPMGSSDSGQMSNALASLL